MLPQLYRVPLSSQLTSAQLLTLEILVWLLQVYKQVKIERLAAQQALLRPVFKLLKKYELVVLGDRELQACGTSSLADREESILCFPSKKGYLNQIQKTALSTVSNLTNKTRNETLFDGDKSHSSSWI
jgi:hypothetical protein